LLDGIQVGPEFARLPAAEAFAVRSHKASMQHDVPTAAGIAYEIPRDKWS
jgi:hypothetical protein